MCKIKINPEKLQCGKVLVFGRETWDITAWSLVILPGNREIKAIQEMNQVLLGIIQNVKMLYTRLSMNTCFLQTFTWKIGEIKELIVYLENRLQLSPKDLEFSFLSFEAVLVPPS